jgi:hypothetical protein
MFPSSKRPMWLARAAMLVYLLTNLSPAGGLVLCIGQDGHVAIEVATPEADCSDCAPREQLPDSCCAAPGPSGQAPAICACADIPLLAAAPDVDRIASSKKVAAGDVALLAKADAGLWPPSLCSRDLRGRGLSPPGSRALVLLPLRI